jgi:hypothetical protein
MKNNSSCNMILHPELLRVSAASKDAPRGFELP